MLASHLGNVTLAGLGTLGNDGQLYKGHQIVIDPDSNTWIINDSYGQELGRGFPTLAAAHRFIDMHWSDPEYQASTDLATQEMLIRTRALEVGDDPDKAVSEWKSALAAKQSSTTDSGITSKDVVQTTSSGVSNLFSGIRNLFSTSSPAQPVPTAPTAPTGVQQPAAPLPSAGASQLPTAGITQMPVQGPNARTPTTMIFNEGPTPAKQAMPYVVMGAVGLAALYVISTSGNKKAPARRRRKPTKKRRKATSKKRRRTSTKRRRR